MTHEVLGLTAPATPAQRRRWLRLVVAVVTVPVVVLAAMIWVFQINPFLDTSVTQAEARAYLDKAVRAGLARDFRTLCRLNGSFFNCETELQSGAQEAVPTAAPESVDAFLAEAGGGVDTPGWVLTVRGRDGRGLRYETEVMVFRDHEAHLKAINIVWWSGAQVVLGEREFESP